MIRQAAKKYNAKRREEEVRSWWRDEEIYEKVKEEHSDDPNWYFLDGPPYASGAVHLGTAWNKLIKDTVLRFKTMQGFDVRRQPGWDCHGLPIEVKVEEKLGLKTKKDIEEKIGIDRFIEKCENWAKKYVSLMSDQFKDLGIWMDWDDPYLTLTDDYIESAWWTLKKAQGKGLLQRDLQVIQWCPRCETALAEHEVRGEYRQVEDPSLFARFKLTYTPNEYLLVWTTTPWTIPANIAVCVNPGFYYAKIAAEGDIYFVAEPLVSKVMDELGIVDYKMVDLVKGEELEGLRYEHPLLEEVPKQHEFKVEHRIICGDHVTLEEGTGCVHTAPGHGQEDFEIGSEYNLPVFSPIGPDGKFTGEAGKYQGKFVKDADEEILNDLEQNDTLMKRGVIRHSYPHCWRCGTALIFRATDQWFLNVDQIRSRILEKNSAKVKWVPQWVQKRYEDGVESVGNWCVSRQRYWGIPLPIWVCENCEYEKVVGSRNELIREATSEVGELGLHRPSIDKVILNCPKCGGPMRRVTDVLDVWFDSGICSWASLNYPKHKDEFKLLWPSDFITEGEDQVTKWFYSQQVASIIAFDEVPYREVLMHGFTLDEEGRKMSKSLGNVVDPFNVVKEYGSDVLRFYMLHASPVWEDLHFSWKEVETINRMSNVFWNIFVFTTTYMSLDEFDPKSVNESEMERHLTPEDRWILSRVNSVCRKVTEDLGRRRFHEATRTLESFVLEDLSRWYIKLVRGRTWIEREDPKKLAAYSTLYEVFYILLRIIAPFMPHMSEVMYQGLVRAADSSQPESVHQKSWPEPQNERINEQLEQDMDVARSLVEAGAKARQEAGIKRRWPVIRAVIRANSSEEKESIQRTESILRNQLNCKEVVALTPEEFSNEIELSCGVDIDVLEEKFGELAPTIKTVIRRMDPDQVLFQLKEQGFVGMQVEGQQIEVGPGAISLQEIPEEFVADSSPHGLVMIDTRVTSDLRAERLARDLVRRLQKMRKEMDLEMEERVDVTVGVGKEELRDLLATKEDYITREVRIRQLCFEKLSDIGGRGYEKKWKINDESFKLAIERLPGVDF